MRDVAAAGGWKEVVTLLRSYQQPDESTLKDVVLTPTHRLVAVGGSRESHNATHDSGGEVKKPHNEKSLQGLKLD